VKEDKEKEENHQVIPFPARKMPIGTRFRSLIAHIDIENPLAPIDLPSPALWAIFARTPRDN
jgi:hypothetical protein